MVGVWVGYYFQNSVSGRNQCLTWPPARHHPHVLLQRKSLIGKTDMTTAHRHKPDRLNAALAYTDMIEAARSGPTRRGVESRRRRYRRRDGSHTSPENEAPAIRACDVDLESNELRMTSTVPTAGGTGHPSAKRAFSRRVVAVHAAAGLAGWLAAPAEGQSNGDSATYTVTFQGEWTTSSTPGGVVGSAHFTTLIGAVHNREVTFRSSGGMATPRIETVAELGSIGTFRDEINAQGTDVASVIRQSVGFGGRGSATFEIEVTTDHPLVTLVSMIGVVSRVFS